MGTLAPSRLRAWIGRVLQSVILLAWVLTIIGWIRSNYVQDVIDFTTPGGTL